MFRCNNQTQFNQKTQNCDWWYNVNCGGRLGSPSDFDQLPASGQQTTVASSAEQQNRQQQQQPDRDAAASSQEEQSQQLRTISGADGTSGSGDRQLETSRQEHLSSAQESSSGQQMGPHSNRWSIKSDGTMKQDESELRADIFHHSESAANITVAPDVNRQQDRQQEQKTFQQQQQQQVAPTSSTPIYAGSSTEPDTVKQQQQQSQSRQEEFSERSSTTRDPLFAQTPTNVNEPSNGQMAASTELSSGLSLAGESRPQVGAVLNGESDQFAQSLTALAAQDVGTQDNSTASNNAATTTSSTSTISDSTRSGIQQVATLETATLSMPQQAASTSSHSPASSTMALTTDEATTQSFGAGQLEQSRDTDENLASNKSRRLVQSEFGLGVQQKQLHRESAAKSARSTARFEFIRNPSSLGDALFSGQLTQYQSAARFNNLLNEQQPAPNHKYNSPWSTDEAQSKSQIYSTSANQGSVSYMPLDDQSSPLITSDKLNQQQQRATQSSTRNKLNRRYGARLQVANLAARQVMPVGGGGSATPASAASSTFR